MTPIFRSNFLTEESLGRLLQVFPGIFICLLILGASLPCIASPVLPGMVLTPNAALRGTEGELLIFVGEPPQAIVPLTVQASAPGQVECATREKNCLYRFWFHQSTIGEATAAAKVGILDATMENSATAKSSAILWVAWRTTQTSIPSGGWQGILLEPFSEKSLRPDEAVSSWDPTSTWYFLENYFARNTGVLYGIASPGWERNTWVRRLASPYPDLNEQSLLGMVRFTKELEPKAKAGVRIVVPYQPVALPQRAILNTLIPPAE